MTDKISVGQAEINEVVELLQGNLQLGKDDIASLLMHKAGTILRGIAMDEDQLVAMINATAVSALTSAEPISITKLYINRSRITLRDRWRATTALWRGARL